jgi:hypothetical protein
MPKSADFDESYIAKAVAAVMREKKPNIAKIAREFDVVYLTLAGRVRKRNPLLSKRNRIDIPFAYTRRKP